MARLILRYPNNVIKEVDFDQPRLRIGTATDNDVVVENEEVEEHQAEIETRDGAFSLKDLSENNSTTVNGKTFETISITYGDRIAFGPVVGLFYPPQKTKMGERSKLLIFMAAGAGLLIIAIALIFLLVSRPDYTDVVTGAAFVEGTAQTGRAVERQPPEEIPQRPEEFSGPEEQALQFESAEESEEGGRQGLFSFLRNRREKLVLLEPTDEDIEKRQAVAVPGGFGRLFFRKHPAPGVRSDAGEAEAAGIVAEGEEIPEEETEYPVEPLVEAIPEIPEITEIPGEQDVFTIQEETSEDRGFASRLFAPFQRLANLFGGEEELELTTEIPLFPTETVAEEETVPVLEPPEEPSVEVVSEAEDLTAVVPEADEEARSTPFSFEETPVYSPEELRQVRAGLSLTTPSLSASETVGSSVLWSYSLPAGPSGPIIVRSGMVGQVNGDRYQDFVFGTALNELVALDGEKGEEVFREDLGAPFLEPLLQDMNGDGTNDIIVVFENGAISVFTYQDTLDTLWHYSGGIPIAVSPALVDVNDDRSDDIVVATLDMDVIALDGRTGFEIWRFFDAQTDINYAPVAVELNNDGVEDILFSTRRGFLYAVDGSNGWGLWKSPLSGRPAGPPTLGDLDDDGDVDIVNLTRSGTLSAHSRTGRLRFSEDMQGVYNVAPTVGDADGDGEEEVLFIDNDSLLKVIEGATRRELWQFASTEGPVNGRIVVNDLNGDGVLEVLIPSLSGALVVLNGQSGDQEALFNSNDRVWVTPLVDDLRDRHFLRREIKSILVCTEKGHIYAVQVQDWVGRLLSFRKTSWVSTHHDIRNTGYVRSGLSFVPWK